MEIEFVDFLPEHFYALELRREDLADLAGADSEALIASWAGGRTLLADGRPVCVYGYAASGGVVCLWMLSGRQVKEMPLLMTKGGRSLISGFFRAGAHRVEAYCHADNVRSLAWLTRGLGFRVEGLMKKSGANAQDRWLLSITSDDARPAIVALDACKPRSSATGTSPSGRFLAGTRSRCAKSAVIAAVAIRKARRLAYGCRFACSPAGLPTSCGREVC